MNKSESIDSQIIKLIEKAIKLHYEGCNDSCKKIGKLSEKIAEISEETDQWENIFSIARNFTDGWSDSCNHEWRYYKGIQQEDWPNLAREIIECVRSKKEVTNKILLHHFWLTKQNNGLFRKLLKLFKV